MPSFKHVVEIDYTPTFRSEKVAGMFDVSVENKLKKEWSVNIPIEEKKWGIGLIVGSSGSGKTTIAKRLFGDKVHEQFKWDKKCLLDDFPKDVDTKIITETLSKVGFSSPPSWLLPYSSLSNGQKFRVELARCLIEYQDIFVFDEFTSVIDRQAAKIGAFAFQKAIRKTNKQFVAVTCHYDVEEWLQPDWVFDVSTNQFKWGCLRRPEIKIEVFRCCHKAWGLFKNHHYLSASINKSARTYVGFIHNEPVALVACLPFPHPKMKNVYKEHRTVVLPDYQGIGVGNIISDMIASLMKKEGKRYISTTSHPSMIHYRLNSKNWKLTKPPKRNSPILRPSKKTGIRNKSIATSRLTAAFEYIGE